MPQDYRTVFVRSIFGIWVISSILRLAVMIWVTTLCWWLYAGDIKLVTDLPYGRLLYIILWSRKGRLYLGHRPRPSDFPGEFRLS